MRPSRSDLSALCRGRHLPASPHAATLARPARRCRAADAGCCTPWMRLLEVVPQWVLGVEATGAKRHRRLPRRGSGSPAASEWPGVFRRCQTDPGRPVAAAAAVARRCSTTMAPLSWTRLRAAFPLPATSRRRLACAALPRFATLRALERRRRRARAASVPTCKHRRRSRQASARWIPVRRAMRAAPAPTRLVLLAGVATPDATRTVSESAAQAPRRHADRDAAAGCLYTFASSSKARRVRTLVSYGR
mmetsp:Transcript_4237/g.15630  ORF Transcript_4237/g.15630 Transcript_4237/m.15630 type:complete len:248 (+) Transcript_4237:3476-4219(+)